MYAHRFGLRNDCLGSLSLLGETGIRLPCFIALFLFCSLPVGAALNTESGTAIQSASQLLEAGQPERARLFLESFLRGSESAAPSFHTFRLKLLYSEALLATGRLEESASEARACESYIESLPETGETMLADRTRLQMHLGDILASLGEYDQSNGHYRSAHSMASDLDPAVVDLKARPLIAWSGTIARQGEQKEFNELLNMTRAEVQRVVDAFQDRRASLTVLDGVLVSFAGMLSDSAVLLRQRELHSEAIERLQFLQEIYAKSSDYPRRAELASEVASACLAAGRGEDAVKYRQHSLDLWQRYHRRLQKSGARNESLYWRAELQLAQARRRLVSDSRSQGRLSVRGRALLQESEDSLERLLQQIAETESVLAGAAGFDLPPGLISKRVDQLPALRLAVLRELFLVDTELARVANSSSEKEHSGNYQLLKQIYDLSSRLRSPFDPETIKTQVLLGMAARDLGDLATAADHLAMARDHLRTRAGATQQGLGSLPQTALLLSRVQRDLAWKRSLTDVPRRIARVRRELEEILPFFQGNSDLPQGLHLQILTTLGILAFEEGNQPLAVSYFEESERRARLTGDLPGVTRALEHRRSALMAGFDIDEAIRAQELLNSLAADKDSSSESRHVEGLLYLASMELARNALPAAARYLAEVSTRCPDSLMPRLRRIGAVYSLKETQRKIESDLPIDPGLLDEAREYWLGQQDPLHSTGHSGMERADSLYRLARLRYLEWIATRRRWVDLYEGPALGRSATYEERRERHRELCEAYNQDVSEYNNQTGVSGEGSRSDERYQQLLLELESLKTLGERLQREFVAQQINRSQIAERADRDLRVMIREALEYARAAVRLLEEARSGALEGSGNPRQEYDPVLHFAAVRGLAEIAAASVTLQRLEDEQGLPGSSGNTLEVAVSALERTAGLRSDPIPVRFGTFASPSLFFGDQQNAAAVGGDNENQAVKMDRQSSGWHSFGPR